MADKVYVSPPKVAARKKVTPPWHKMGLSVLVVGAIVILILACWGPSGQWFWPISLIAIALVALPLVGSASPETSKAERSEWESELRAILIATFGIDEHEAEDAISSSFKNHRDFHGDVFGLRSPLKIAVGNDWTVTLKRWEKNEWTTLTPATKRRGR